MIVNFDKVFGFSNNDEEVRGHRRNVYDVLEEFEGTL